MNSQYASFRGSINSVSNLTFETVDAFCSTDNVFATPARMMPVGRATTILYKQALVQWELVFDSLLATFGI